MWKENDKEICIYAIKARGKIRCGYNHLDYLYPAEECFGNTEICQKECACYEIDLSNRVILGFSN